MLPPGFFSCLYLGKKNKCASAELLKEGEGLIRRRHEEKKLKATQSVGHATNFMYQLHGGTRKRLQSRARN